MNGRCFCKPAAFENLEGSYILHAFVNWSLFLQSSAQKGRVLYAFVMHGACFCMQSTTACFACMTFVNGRCFCKAATCQNSECSICLQCWSAIYYIQELSEVAANHI